MQMKVKFYSVLLFLLSVHALSAQTFSDNWSAIKKFHTVISETFHPAEEGNLKPIKLRCLELSTMAAALLESDIPAEFRTKSILTAVEKLVVKSKIVHKLVSLKAPDEDIVQSLTELHDIFHDIVGLCTNNKK